MSSKELIEIHGDGTIMSKPDLILKRAVAAMIETCNVQLELEMKPAGKPIDFEKCDYAYGSAIGLTSASGGMLFVFMCDTKSAEHLTRLLFAMEEDEDVPTDDLTDALKESVNVAAGVLKTNLADTESDIKLGLPLFLGGKASLQDIQKDVKGMGQRLENEFGISMNVNVIWQEGTGK